MELVADQLLVQEAVVADTVLATQNGDERGCSEGGAFSALAYIAYKFPTVGLLNSAYMVTKISLAS